MSISTVTRKDVREAIKTDLTDYLTSTVQAIYEYQKADFGHNTPVVRILSEGTRVEPESFDSFVTLYYINIQIWVLRYSVTSGWTEQEAEDLIDVISHAVGMYMDEDMTGKIWRGIEYADRSQVVAGGEEVGGEMYLIEDIPVIVTCD